ncbi:MAG: hypothetical protein R2715_21810 [Ilumatobacteraceae bacterium]
MVISLTPDEPESAQARQFALDTGGVAQYVQSDSSDIDRAILAGLSTLPVDLKPTFVDGSCPIERVSFEPEQTMNVSANEQVPFELSFRVASDAQSGRFDCQFQAGPGQIVSIPMWVSA